MFLFTAIAMTLTIGLFLAFMFTQDIKKTILKVIAIILIASLVGFGIAGLMWMEHKGDTQSWNNGICPCGEEWRLVSVDHLKNGGDLYYYTCDNCHRTIRTHSNMN